jgi:hypothetical protein
MAKSLVFGDACRVTSTQQFYAPERGAKDTAIAAVSREKAPVRKRQPTLTNVQETPAWLNGPAPESVLMSSFPPLTEADLSRARTDPAFRQKLLQQSLDALLGRLQKERQMPSSVAAKPGQMREGVTLAVRLAELIQTSEPTPES